MKSADYLHAIVNIIETSPKFLNYAIVKKSKLEENIDYIYAVLPVEIQEKRAEDKNFKINDEIYDLLKMLEICLENSIVLFFCQYSILKLSEIQQIICKLAEIIPEYNN